MESPTDAAPPPSYQMSVEEFDQKTTRAVQLSSSSIQIGEDGWQIYDPTAFEAVAESSTHSPPASSSAGFLGAESSRNERQVRLSLVKAPPSPKHMKTKSAERNRYNPQRDDGHEHRVATPPPPFTPNGPSLDGPPFEEVVRLDYEESESQAASPLEPTYSPPAESPPPPPALQPVEPLRLPPNRHSDSHVQTSRNPYPPSRPSPTLSDIFPRSNPASTITRVEFDPRMAYSSNGGVGDHTAIHAGATAFYNHAVASQLHASSALGAPTQQSSYSERISSPYSSGYSPTTYQQQQHTMYDQYQYQEQSLPFIAPGPLPPLPGLSPPTSPPPGAGFARFSNGTGRGPLPRVPTPNVPLPHAQWGGSQVHIQDVYGRN